MTKDYKQGLVTGLAMHPLYVGPIYKKIETTYFGTSGIMLDIIKSEEEYCDWNISQDGILSPSSFVGFDIGQDFRNNVDYYFDMSNLNETDKITTWTSLNNTKSILLNNVSFSNEKALAFTSSSYGSLSMSEEPNTIYFYGRCPSGGTFKILSKDLVTKSDTQTADAHWEFDLQNNSNYIHLQSDTGWDSHPDRLKFLLNSADYHLYCCTRSVSDKLYKKGEGNKLAAHYTPSIKIYQDGVLIAERINSQSDSNTFWRHGAYDGAFSLNRQMLDGKQVASGGTVYFKMLAFSTKRHSDEQVKANTEIFYTKLIQ